MRKTTLFLVLLVVFLTILIAGCTQQQPEIIPKLTPVITALPTLVINPLPTFPSQINPTVANLTEKTEQKIVNLTEKTENTIANLTNKTEQKMVNLTEKTGQKMVNLTNKI